MSNMKTLWLERYEKDPAVSGVIAVESADESSPLIDGFDLLLLVMAETVPRRVPFSII